MFTSRAISTPHVSSRRRLSRGTGRRGLVVVLLLVSVLITVLAAMLVLNLAYLVLVQRNMQQRSDILALTGVTELLDEAVLADAPPNQADDVLHAETAVQALSAINNDVGVERLRLEWSDIHVTPTAVLDMSMPADESNLDVASPFNALWVHVRRDRSGSNPVDYLINGFWRTERATVQSTSCAALDNHVIGFRPTDNISSPVVPLAIKVDAWNHDRRSDLFPPDGNGRRELILTLGIADSECAAANAVVVALDSRSIAMTELVRQIEQGVTAGDLPDGFLGPATSTTPLVLPARRAIGNRATARLAQALNDVATSDRPRRVFPLYQSFSLSNSHRSPGSRPRDNGSRGSAKLIGFVAATVFGAKVTQQPPDPSSPAEAVKKQLRVTVEPAFLVHCTTWTDPDSPEQNPYIHKLRLVR